MNLFQKCLLAPAALGLMAPVAAAAADLNIAGLSQYSNGKDQVTSIGQFSDVRPTDWAYQALTNLIERYGCVAGYPNGSFKGGQAISRYEAAALLNACLDRITEVTDELKRLMKEFEKELAVLKGRVDGLEAKVGELEATQFSTTTRLRADTRWVLGGQTFGGTGAPGNNRGYSAGINRAGNTYQNGSYASGTPLLNALSFNYDVRLNFDTSFTGKDLLRTQLRAGNFSDSSWGANPARTSNLDAAFQENCGTGVDCGDVVAINRLYYKFPISNAITVIAGARMRQDDYFAVWPSVYTGDKILKQFQFTGSPVANAQVLGAGGGIFWKQPKANKADTAAKWSLSAGYLAQNGGASAPGQEYGSDCTSVTTGTTGSASTAEGGIGNKCSVGQSSVQLALTGTNWNISGLYTYNQTGVSIQGTQSAIQAVSEAASTNAFNLAGYWQPLKNGWIPSISAGWGIANSVAAGQGAAAGNSYALRGANGVSINRGTSLTSQSWMVGLNWKDAFQKGNVLGMAVGQTPFITGNTGGYANQDGNYAWEWYYKLQVTDHIAVTPAIFYLSRPQGEQTGTANSFDSFGYLVQTTFKF